MIYLTWRTGRGPGMLNQLIRGTHGFALIGAESSDTA
jgi:hypothetical protein